MLSTTSRVVFCDMHLVTSQIYSTLNKYINGITGNKKPLYAPYPHWFGLILSRDERYDASHGIIIPIGDLSSMIINATPSQGDLPIGMRMQKWSEKPYVVEFSDFEDDDENDNEDGYKEAGNKEGANKEEDIEKDEE
ncbi:unnamed protein product [Lactuca saligna]|uniref:Uncharacterized protein n=1 Tax=Lactuca saligna TaxID=75948 RepID=A0AA36ED38_LACSI|nr:unnamed protein product [Lactuca saligna]